MEGIYFWCVSSWARKRGSRAALLPGRVFDVPGLLAKRSALSCSGNTGPDVSLLRGLCVHGLLEPGYCSIPALLCPGAAAPPSLVCQPHPSHPSCTTWLIWSAWAGGWQRARHSTAPAPRARGAGACPELLGVTLMGFFHIFTQLIDFLFEIT